jgi:hypothetical protein
LIEVALIFPARRFGFLAESRKKNRGQKDRRSDNLGHTLDCCLHVTTPLFIT